MCVVRERESCVVFDYYVDYYPGGWGKSRSSPLWEIDGCWIYRLTFLPPTRFLIYSLTFWQMDWAGGYLCKKEEMGNSISAQWDDKKNKENIFFYLNFLGDYEESEKDFPRKSSDFGNRRSKSTVWEIESRNCVISNGGNNKTRALSTFLDGLNCPVNWRPLIFFFFFFLKG